MVDLVDYKDAIALPLERLCYNLLTVPGFITRSSVNEIQARVDGTPDRCDQLRQRQLAVGQIANPQHSGHKTSASQHTAGMEENLAHGCSLCKESGHAARRVAYGHKMQGGGEASFPG